MTIPQYRLILPASHFVIDCIVLGLWLWHSGQWLSRGQLVTAEPRLASVALAQESGAVEWRPRYIDPSPEFSLLIVGSFPAGIISTSLRPEAHVQYRGKLWDPAWFAIHEAISFPLWFLIGLFADVRHGRFGGLMLLYVAVRMILTVTDLIAGHADVGWRIEAIVWLIICFWLLAVVLKRLYRIGARALRRA